MRIFGLIKEQRIEVHITNDYAGRRNAGMSEEKHPNLLAPLRSYAPEVRDHVHQQRALSSRLYSYAEDHNDKF